MTEMHEEITRIGEGFEELYKSACRDYRVLYRALLEIALEDDRAKRLTLTMQALEQLKR